MRLIVERPYPRYRSTIFVDPCINVISTSVFENQNQKILAVVIEKYTLTSICKPLNKNFEFTEPNYTTRKIHFMIGNFNSQSISWRYIETNEDRNAVEEWALA